MNTAQRLCSRNRGRGCEEVSHKTQLKIHVNHGGPHQPWPKLIALPYHLCAYVRSRLLSKSSNSSESSKFPLNLARLSVREKSRKVLGAYDNI